MFKIRKKIDNESFNKMEEFSLYNGKKAYLEYVNDNPQSFIIRAKDCHGNVVGACYFNIENGRCFEPNDVTVLGNINAKRGYFLGKVPVRCHALRLSKACKREYLNY